VIQVLLGHSKLDTTALYARAATETIRAVTSPLERLAMLMQGEEPGGRSGLRASIEVADILRAEGAGYRAAQAAHLNLTQLKVMSAIEICRTTALGGHVDACEDCGHQRIAYNSCLMGQIR
jgi:hypothetical protein